LIVPPATSLFRSRAEPSPAGTALDPGGAEGHAVAIQQRPFVALRL